MMVWAGEYFKWLTTSELALKESASKNNHGSYYDVQAMYFALYSENLEAATRIAKNFTQRRVLAQIKPDGSMPEEMARTRPLFYSIYNLHAMFLVASLAERVNIDIWQADKNDSRLQVGLDYIAPYADPNKVWPHPTIGAVDRMEMFAILQMADSVYPGRNYMDFAKQLPLERRIVQRSNLALPLMR